MKLKTKILCFLLCVSVLLCLVGCKNNETQNNDGTSAPTEETNDVVVDPTEPIYDPLKDTVDGIPRINFESTQDRDFDFCLKNKETGIEYPIGYGIKFSSVQNSYEFFVSEQNSNLVLPPESPILPNETTLIVESGKNNWENTFVFGVLNTTNDELYAKDCDLIYVEFRGDTECTICGIETKMTYDQVVAKLGNPSQEVEFDSGYSMTYFVLKDNHAYVIGVKLDSRDGVVTEITLNVGNHPVYVNNFI